MGLFPGDLEVYRRAVEFADKVLFLTEKTERRNEFLSDLLRRTAVSIPLILAEGCGRSHAEAGRESLAAARGACFKCLPLLFFLKCSGGIGALTCAALEAEVQDISNMLIFPAGRKP